MWSTHAARVSETVSESETLWLAAFWSRLGYLGVAILLVACLWPHMPGGGGSGVDKLLHLAAFAALAAWFGALMTYSRYAPLALALATLGLLIEGLQWLTGYRSAELFDWLADLAGIAVGLAIARPLVAPVLEYVDSRVAAAAARNRA